MRNSHSESLPSKGRLMGLDLGTRRTGVAISDESQRVSFLRDPIQHQNQGELVKALEEIIQAEQVQGLVVGWPLTLKGREEEQTDFVTEILEHFNLPKKVIDERFSTVLAKRSHTDVLDSESARLLLELYFELRQ